MAYGKHIGGPLVVPQGTDNVASLGFNVGAEQVYEGGENTELSLRLALRGTWYLGADESERA